MNPAGANRAAAVYVRERTQLAWSALRECWRLAAGGPRGLRDDEAFVRAVYRALLKREPDHEGLNTYLGALSAGYPFYVKARKPARG